MDSSFRPAQMVAGIVGASDHVVIVVRTRKENSMSELWKTSPKSYIFGHYYKAAGNAKVCILNKGTMTSAAFYDHVGEIKFNLNGLGCDVEIYGNIDSFLQKYDIPRERKSAIMTHYFSN